MRNEAVMGLQNLEPDIGSNFFTQKIFEKVIGLFICLIGYISTVYLGTVLK